MSAASGEAVIGESLQVEVPVTGTMDRPLDSDCVSVRRVPEGLDPEYFPRDLVARVDRQSGTPRILVATHAAVRQPLVEFRVFVACGYNLFRDYLLMAAPRRESPVAAPAAAAAPMPTARPAPATSAAVAAPVVAAIQRLPDGIAGRNIVLDRDMTLEQLARQHFPGPLRQQRFMRWVVEANPQYFAGTGSKLRQQRLSAGTALVVPGTVPPRRPGDHQGGVTPLGEKLESGNAGTAADASVKPKAAAGGATTNAGAKDRLVVGGGSYARNLKETVALVDQLTGMMEKQLEAQTAYNEKIQQLEATVDGLGKQVKTLEAAADKREAQWRAERQAEKVEREQEAERAWWKLLAAALAGGLLGGGALLALRTFAARKNDDAVDEVPELAAAADPEPLPVPAAAPKHAPLTQFGWDDDAPQAPPPAESPAIPAPAAEPAPASEAAPPAASGTKPAPAATHHIDFELPTSMTAAGPESYDPANAAIELANIMTSMGLAESAAQTLVEHIRENPRESLPQWLKLLEIHRLNGNRSEFERSATEMRQHFNVQPEEWNAAAPQGRNSLEAYPHIRSQIVKLWRRPECVTLLRALLLDNREGTRIGFPLPVAEEILLLIAIHNSSK